VSARPIKRVKRGVNLKLTHTRTHARKFMNLKNAPRCPKLISLTLRRTHEHAYAHTHSHAHRHATGVSPFCCSCCLFSDKRSQR